MSTERHQSIVVRTALSLAVTLGALVSTAEITQGEFVRTNARVAVLPPEENLFKQKEKKFQLQPKANPTPVFPSERRLVP